MKTLIKTFKNAESRFFGRTDAILDITATGRYWRTSQLKSVTLLRCDQKSTWLTEKESDEPDLLTALTDELGRKDPEGYFVEHIITFNGNAFDLPHLHRKYAAYGFLDPLNGKAFTDLFLTYASYKDFFGLPGRKLSDYASFAAGLQNGGDPFSRDDADRTYAILPLRSYMDALNGIITSADKEGNTQRPAGNDNNSSGQGVLPAGQNGRLSLIFSDAVLHDSRIYYTLTVNAAFPREFSRHDTVFHIRFNQNRLQISVPIEEGKLRIYHTDIKNYYYLPQEGYAIHSASAAFVDKRRKEKATRENCFQYVPYGDSYLDDCERTRKYLRTVLDYLKSPR